MTTLILGAADRLERDWEVEVEVSRSGEVEIVSAHCGSRRRSITVVGPSSEECLAAHGVDVEAVRQEAFERTEFADEDAWADR
jgi:hypothetical protein